MDERNHLRVWLTPLRYQGLDVWIGQISRDIGVRLSSKTVFTHQIDPEVDETRYYLVQDLLLSGGVVKIGWVTGVGQAPISAPRFNYTGDPYYTDGIRVVLLMGEQHVPLEAIQYFPWGDPRNLVPQASRPSPPKALPCLVSWASCSRIPWYGWRAPPTHPGEASRHLWLCDMRVRRVTRSHSRTLVICSDEASRGVIPVPQHQAITKNVEHHRGAIRYFIGASNLTRATA